MWPDETKNMSDLVIQAENISKFYQLGTIGSGSLRRDIQSWWQTKILNKGHPYHGLSEADAEDSRDFIWALRNVNMEIRQGETWGIIGKNGAGKSTFLKILSRIIKPTSGSIRGRGKISSLLEVGTGFHQDLSGRENIYISGYMLGMKKAEIESKFDEIVNFSGIEKFIDTPVKRYSSGMYVRLAFAVAAHLEPDILIVDEILAVGDAEFQKKCMGKMKDVSSSSGRTIIFVSHNLQAVNNLCSKAIWLDRGSVKYTGYSNSVVNHYLSTVQKKSWKQEFGDLQSAPGNEYIRLLSIELVPHLSDPVAGIDIRTPLTIKYRFFNGGEGFQLSTDILLFTLAGECIFDVPSVPGEYNKGIIDVECTIPGNFLNDGSYYISINFTKDTSVQLFKYEECLFFEVADFRENSNFYDKWWGYVRPAFPLLLTPVDENSFRNANGECASNKGNAFA
jgi:lipopolysaccharide transport system ATP-binding protein